MELLLLPWEGLADGSLSPLSIAWMTVDPPVQSKEMRMDIITITRTTELVTVRARRASFAKLSKQK
jgi:hypothetical protein